MLRQILSTALLVSLACGDGVAATADDQAASGPAANPAPAAAKLSETASAAAKAASKGAVTGTIKFEGTPPARSAVDTTPDPVCHEMHKDAPLQTPGGVLVGADGGLADVFVQLTGVPDEKYETPAEPVVLDQHGCTYVPHVFGAMKKQEIKILNSDPTLHNIHAQPRINKEFNLAMPNKGDERTQEFKKAEDAVHIKCDVHPWMSTFCFVMEHPYFAVTGADGKFSIDCSKLPDGEYGVKLWQEVLGEKEGKVTVKDGAGSFDFTYKG